MRGTEHTPDRGAQLLLQHVQALITDAERQRPPRDRLSDRIGRGLSDLLLQALTTDHGIRRRDPRA